MKSRTLQNNLEEKKRKSIDDKYFIFNPFMTGFSGSVGMIAMVVVQVSDLDYESVFKF